METVNGKDVVVNVRLYEGLGSDNPLLYIF